MGPNLMLMLVTLASASVPQTDSASGDTLVRVRTTEPMVLEVIREGRRRSATFAALIERVERSNTFVYVVRVHMLPHRMEGCLVHEGDGSSRRYLRLLLAMGTPRERMIVVLAHELQHVGEVLDAGIALNPAAMDGLFKRIGSRQRGSDTGEQYETAAAQHVMAVVERELRTPARMNTDTRRDGSIRHISVVRPMAPALSDALENGRRRAQTLSRLIDHLESSDLIVYLRLGSCPDPQSVACLSMIGASRSNRFVQITFVMQMHGVETILAAFTDHLIAQIGHELQHAVEIADDSTIVNGPTLEAAYRRWGFRPDPKTATYESVKAIQAGESVLNELRRSKANR